MATSSLSSSSLLTEGESKFNSIRPGTSSLSYVEFGDSIEEDMNGLKTEWNLSFENKILLQSVWANHPKRQQGKRTI